MKLCLKRAASLLLCAVLLISIVGTSAFALEAEAYAGLPYKCYTYVGDSIAWGYGLDLSIDTKAAESVCLRVGGSYGDAVGKVLENNNCAEVYCSASSGARMSDFRMLIERGMGVENPYTYPDDWFGNRGAVRTRTLREKGNDICAWLSRSDLITVQVGINDLTGALVNSLAATGVLDLEKLTAISDVKTFEDYVLSALATVSEDPNLAGRAVSAFSGEIAGLRENSREVVRDIVALAPDTADILLVGYHDAAQCFRVIPGLDYSLLFDLVNAALVSLNDYYFEIAAEYGNVYFVSAPDADMIFSDGMPLTEALGNVSGILLGVHPDAEGQEYIAGRILDKLTEINTCRHENTVTKYGQSAGDVGYSGVTVCRDCGQILSAGKLDTPAGQVDVPENLLSYTLKNIDSAVKSTALRIAEFFSSIFGR